MDEESGAIWIHGDLHVENFGTYLNAGGRLVFDVNDFDEAYIGHFTWDLQRFAASLALVGWQKALPEDDVVRLIGRYVRAYLSQVNHYAGEDGDEDFALHLDNTDGPILEALVGARQIKRADLLDELTHVEKGVRVFTEDDTIRHLSQRERAKVEKAFRSYLDTIPPSKRFDRKLFYDLRDVVGKAGFGIGSAGLPAYNLLVEGYSQALDNDVVLSMKQANVPALSRFVDRSAIDGYFDHEGHRTVVSQRALQVHTDPLLGYAEMDDVGYVVSELSPYEVDLDWDGLTEPDDIAAVVEQLGRATAKIHCAADEDSDHDLVDFQVEAAIVDVARRAATRVRRARRRVRSAVREARAPGPRPVRRRLSRGADRRRGYLTPCLPRTCAPGPGSATKKSGAPQPCAAKAVVTAIRTASTRSTGTRAMAEPAEATSRHPGAERPRLPGGVDGDIELVARHLVVVDAATRATRRAAPPARSTHRLATPQRTRPRDAPR